MNITAEKLPENVQVLKQMLLDSQERFDKETGILLEQIRLLRQQLYGRKSEKMPIPGSPQPLPLFDLPEPDSLEPVVETTEVPAHTRKKGGRKPLPENLPRVEVIHDISEEEKICGCGQERACIGQEISEQLEIIPAKLQVIRHIRLKYACKGCDGLEDDGPVVKIAPVVPQIIPKSIASPSLLAHVLTGKFVDAVPFYRQEKQFIRLGIDLSRTSMSAWTMKGAEVCQPLLNLLQDEILVGPYINMDETTIQVLKEPGRDPTSKSYMWIFRRGDPEKPVLVYQYHPSRSGKVAADFLCDFQGYVQTDGYSGYDFLDQKKGIHHLGCLAHARRKFMDVVKAQGKNRKAGSADVALGYIKELYKIEKEGNDLPFKDMYKLRQEKSKPILEKFHEWLLKKAMQTPPKGLLGKATTYALNQWDRLVGYLADGRLSPDNNAAENAIRHFVIGRKNWLFGGTPEGAAASALFYSLIETAKANKLEPHAYLRFIFEKLPTATTLEDYEALLPWNVKNDLPALSCISSGADK